MSSQPGYNPEMAATVGDIDPKLYDAARVVLFIQGGVEVTTQHQRSGDKRPPATPRVGVDSELCGISEPARLAEQVARLSGLKR